MQQVDEALLAAFRAARYRFDTEDGELLLAVDSPDAGLLAFLRKHAADSAAILTAFNPRGRIRSDPENRAAQQQLQDELVAAGHELLPGHNEDPAGLWPREPSFLVPGLTLDAARTHAVRHHQAAFLWVDAASGTPRLVAV